MILKIITTQKATELEVKWVELNTPVGNMVIQEGHIPMMIELSAGQELLYQAQKNKTESIMIIQGIAHITRKEIKILLPIDL